MAFIQQTFLGASISNFSANVGWGNQPSVLNVQVVEDSSNGDLFSPGIVGSPKYFNYSGWTFGGILQSWKAQADFTTNPSYDITINDPREILDGVQLILDGYNGSTQNLPNLYNVYGYLESTLGFGGAGVNSGGIPWQNVTTAMNALLSSNPISFRGFNYRVNLTSIPSVPSYYRIGGDSISLLGFIDDICSAALRDYFFTLELINGINTIVLYTISRANAPQIGKISQFISSTDGANSKDIGLELRNETVSKFVVGGQVSRLYFQFRNEEDSFDRYDINGDGFIDIEDLLEIDSDKVDALITLIENGDDDGDNKLSREEYEAVIGSDDEEDDSIVPFWGFGPDNKPIELTPVRDEDNNIVDRYFVLDSRRWNIPRITYKYTTSINEMRAVLAGRASWETYLWSEKGRVYGDESDSVHANKASFFKLTGNVKDDIRELLTGKTPEEIKALTPYEYGPLTKSSSEAAGGDKHEENIAAIFSTLEKYANEYYGKQFMVRIPFVAVKRDSETNKIVTSLEPSDSGFLEESVWPTAIQNNLMPADVNGISETDGRITAYVKFDNADTLDTAAVSESDKAYNEQGDTLFVKASVNPKIIFIDEDTLFSPRAVVQINGAIFEKDTRDVAGVLRLLITDVLSEKGIEGDDADEIILKLLHDIGGDAAYYDFVGEAKVPNMACIPLSSNILTYGPWYAIGADGKVEFEKDDSLVPWNYGGYTLMNLVGNSKVNLASSNQQFSETGSVTFPGVPSITIGGPLVAAGPYVTGINCSIQENGVTTTYQMQTWTRQFGKLAKANIDRLTKMSRQAQEQRRNIRQLLKVPPASDPYYARRRSLKITDDISKAKSGRSTHPMILGQIKTNESDGSQKSIIASFPMYNVPTSLHRDYEEKFGGSLDTIFSPFATNPNTSGMPTYTTPSSSEVPNASSLNPFQTGSNFNVLVRDSVVPSSLVLASGDSLENARPVGLRMPLIGVGWGYDDNGKPVPNSNPSSPTTTFDPDYLTDYSKWKAGPIDIRWNESKGMWIATGDENKVFPIQASSTLYPGQSAIAYIGQYDSGSNSYNFGPGSFGKLLDIGNRNLLLPGESAFGFLSESGVYHIIDSFGLHRFGIATSGISHNSTGLVLLGQNQAVTAKLSWMNSGGNIPSNSQVEVAYLSNIPGESNGWFVVGAPCASGCN